MHTMHKLLTIAVFLVPFILGAQPVITSDWFGQPGDMISTADSEVIPDVAPSGADVTWDFTNVVEEDSTRVPLLYVQADTTEFIADFPGANQCLYTDFNDPDAGFVRAYQYLEVSDGEWQLHGNTVASSLGTIGTSYSNTEKLLQFPFEFEDGFSDFYGGEIDLGVVTTQFEGFFYCDCRCIRNCGVA